LAKVGTLHTRRQAIATLRQPATVAQLFSTIAPQYEGRTGGYTRIMRLGQRVGDAADMCILELIPVTTTPTDAAVAATAEKAAEAAPAEKTEAKES
jgi:large subunit ribosomal protein L17